MMQSCWRFFSFFVVVLVNFWNVSRGQETAPFVIDATLLNLTRVAVELSDTVYRRDDLEPVAPVFPEGVENFTVYQALSEVSAFATYQGYCFVAFRGTITSSLREILQVYDPRFTDVCSELTNTDCCAYRSGFAANLLTPYLSELSRQLRACASTCIDMDNCVVLTGHSSGAVAAGAGAVYWADLNPLVISFGEPRSVKPPCAAVNGQRYFRWANSMLGLEDGDLQYEFAVFDRSPLSPGLVVRGHFILMSDDPTRVAYLGTDRTLIFTNTCVDCHYTTETAVNLTLGVHYNARIAALYENAFANPGVQLPTTGFPLNTLCSVNNECESKACVEGQCRAERLERCSACTRSEECDSGRCQKGLWRCGRENIFSRVCV